MANSIHHKLFFPHPPEIVWEYLTKSNLMAQWLMENDFEPLLGFDFQFRHNPMPAHNLDGIMYCKVLEIVPYKRLSYSWKAGPGDGKFIMDSIVVWTLYEREGGTELQLDHTGVDSQLSIYPIINVGWFENMEKILKLINNLKHDSIRS